MNASHELSVLEIDHARGFLMDVGAYGPFDLLSDGRRLTGCMDWRADDIDGRQMTKVMGPGGEAGEAGDHRKALTAVSGSLITIEEALREDLALIRADVPGAHPDCAYIASVIPITRETASPSEPTTEMVSKWVIDNELESIVTLDVQKRVIGAAALELVDLEAAGGIDHLVSVIDTAYPEHGNVNPMRGGPIPAFYIVNGYPHLGLNRHLKHDKRQLLAAAYHDNLRARLDNVNNTHTLPADVRAHRMGALLFRSASTRTIIDAAKRAAGHPVEHWEITVGTHGPRFNKIDFEAAA